MLKLHLTIEPDEARELYEALAKCWHSSETARDLVDSIGQFLEEVAADEADQE